MPPDLMDRLDPTGAGRRRSALMRPSLWSGEHAVPMQGAFCSTCQGQHWVGFEGGWFCTVCHPQAEACGGGRYVNTGSTGHG